MKISKAICIRGFYKLTVTEIKDIIDYDELRRLKRYAYYCDLKTIDGQTVEVHGSKKSIAAYTEAFKKL